MATTPPDGIRPAIVGSFGPAEAACLTSWHRAGLAPVFVHITDRKSLPFLGGILSAYMTLPRTAFMTPEGLQRVARFLADAGISGLATLGYHNAAWLAENSEMFDGICDFWFAHGPVLHTLITKDDQIDRAGSAGFEVLETWRLPPGAGAESLPTDAFPIVIRPDDPDRISPMLKAVLCRDAASLDRFIGRLTQFAAPLIAQPFVYGPNLVVHGARGRDGRHIDIAAFVSGRKFEGVTLNIRRTALAPEIERACRRFVDSLGLVGVYHFDLILNEATGRAFFLEINGRLGGTTAKAFALGFDEPAFLVEAFTGFRPPARRQARENAVAASKLAALKRIAGVLRGWDDPLDYPRQGKPAEIARLLAGLLAWRDPMLSAVSPRIAAAYIWETLFRRG